jgi:hypothetical protein
VTAGNDGGSTSLQALIADSLARQTEILERMVRPYVVVDVRPRRYVNALYFRVRNVGQTPAFQIRVTPDKAVPIGRGSSSELNIFNEPISVLGTGDEISFFFGSAADLLGEEESILQFDVELRYADSNGKSYEEKISVDIDLLRGLAFELPAIDEILTKLDQTRREISKIARYAQRLSHKDMQAWARQEQASESVAKTDVEADIE